MGGFGDLLCAACSAKHIGKRKEFKEEGEHLGV
jgi:hypothetical protein